MSTDLFGNSVEERLPGGPMCQRFLEPPFTVLDARSDRWQQRKRDWAELGMQSELGRDVAGKQVTGKNTAMLDGAGGVVSIFDPVVCELIYSWFMPNKQGNGVLDPFAGGSVRGIVAGRLGVRYTGIELRFEQVEANTLQGCQISCATRPLWIHGDSRNTETLVGTGYDLIFTCPPYWNLERYSDSPEDLSTLNDYPQFIAEFGKCMGSAATRLANNRFAVIVVGNVRDKGGNFVDLRGDTVRLMESHGFRLYNDFVIVTPVGSLPLRAGKQFAHHRKAGKSHQHALCFYRGDTKSIRSEFPDAVVRDSISEASEPLLPSGESVSGSRDESQSNEQNLDTSERA